MISLLDENILMIDRRVVGKDFFAETYRKSVFAAWKAIQKISHTFLALFHPFFLQNTCNYFLRFTCFKL